MCYDNNGTVYIVYSDNTTIIGKTFGITFINSTNNLEE